MLFHMVGSILFEELALKSSKWIFKFSILGPPPQKGDHATIRSARRLGVGWNRVRRPNFLLPIFLSCLATAQDSSGASGIIRHSMVLFGRLGRYGSFLKRCSSLINFCRLLVVTGDRKTPSGFCYDPGLF